jgi:hypothetical protein
LLLMGAAMTCAGCEQDVGCRLTSEWNQRTNRLVFAMALTQLGVGPSAVAYVGDNPESDIVGAKTSGLFAIWKRDTFWAEPKDADWIIDDLAELPSGVNTNRKSPKTTATKKATRLTMKRALPRAGSRATRRTLKARRR